MHSLNTLAFFTVQSGGTPICRVEVCRSNYLSKKFTNQPLWDGGGGGGQGEGDKIKFFFRARVCWPLLRLHFLFLGYV
jgi:hypothetical protein